MPMSPTYSRLAALLAGTMLLVQPAIAVAGPPPPPGQAPFDEVRLPNHGLVRGDVTELVPGRYVVLTKRNGEIRRFEWSQIESIVLADGTVLDKNTTPGTMPEPTPDPNPDPNPDPGPDVVPDPQPDPDPAPVDFDPIEPVKDPSSAVADDAQPSQATPRVIITPNKSSRPPAAEKAGPQLALRRVTSRGREVGSKLPADVPSEPVCEGACGVLVERPTDEFFIAVDGKPIARGFQLGSTNSSYEIKVRRKSAVKRWSGVALIPAAILVGVGIGIIPALHNVPKERVAGYAVGGALIGLAGIGGGVTLILFSFDKVKVLPGVAK
jgi:hypothetical protein